MKCRLVAALQGGSYSPGYAMPTCPFVEDLAILFAKLAPDARV